MSIEMENPQTPLEMADALANLVQEMHIAHIVRDESEFRRAHRKASEIAAGLVDALDNAAAGGGDE